MCRPRLLPLAAGLAVLGLALPVLAEAVQQVSIQIVVSHVSRSPGPVDPRGAELHRQLRNDFRFQSLRVLEQRLVRLRIDEIGQMRLPNGSMVRLRPLQLSGDRLLVAVEVGDVQTDLRMHNHRKVVISHPQPWENGRLVISFEPSF